MFTWPSCGSQSRAGQDEASVIHSWVKVKLQRLAALEEMIPVTLWDSPAGLATTLISHILHRTPGQTVGQFCATTMKTWQLNIWCHVERISAHWIFHYHLVVLALLGCSVFFCVCVQNSHLLSGLLWSFLTFLLQKFLHSVNIFLLLRLNFLTFQLNN